jgi:hypothetical protein
MRHSFRQPWPLPDTGDVLAEALAMLDAGREIPSCVPVCLWELCAPWPARALDGDVWR